MIHKEPTSNHDFMCDVNYVVCLLYPIISDYIDYMRINHVFYTFLRGSLIDLERVLPSTFSLANANIIHYVT